MAILNDKWIPQQSTFRPQSSTRFLPADTKVAMLIDHSTHQWNHSMIATRFNSTEAAISKRIRLNPYQKPDKMIWRCTPTGTFSIKIAYYLKAEMDKKEVGQASEHRRKFEPWTKVWHLHIPNATKSFLWRAYLNALP